MHLTSFENVWKCHEAVEKTKLKKKQKLFGSLAFNKKQQAVYTLFFNKNNFIRTKALVLIKNLRTS